MKVCLIHSLYKPYTRGGAEVVVDIIINELLNLGHEVILITVGRKNAIQREGKLTIYRIHPLNVFSFLDINERPVWLRIFWHPLDVFNFSSYKKVKNILTKEKPAVVMTHNLKGLGYMIPKAIRRVGIKHVHTVHDVQLSRPSGLVLFGQEKPFLIIDKIYERFSRKLFASPDVVVSPSKWLMKYYTSRGFFYESKKEILPNPIVFKKVDKILHQAEGGTKTQDSAKKDNKIIFIYVGQLERFKGILFLIRVFLKIPSQNWELIIVGDGRAEDQAKKLIAGDNRFKMVGRIDNDELTKYYRQADLTIVPSLCYENSPKVIDESLIANVPVIAADIGGVPEIIQDEYNGFTFAAGNEESLTSVLTHYMNHPENIEKLKKNSFISVRNFSVSNYIKKLFSLI